MSIPNLIFLIIIFTFFLIAYVNRSNKKTFKKNRQIIIDLIKILFISFIVLISFGQMLTAKWSPVDDHEIVSYLGSDSKTSFKEFFPILLSTEVGDFGSALRVRPAYYSLRILETIFWGANTSAWYAIRILICIISLFLYWKTFENFYSPLIAGAGVLLLFSHYSTLDIFGQLGPGETYGYLAVAAFFWIYLKIISSLSQKNKLKKIELFLLSISYLIAIGVKESLFILVAPMAHLYLLALTKKEKSLKLISSFLLILTAVLIVGLLKALFLAKQDFYANPIFTSTRLLNLMNFLFNSHYILFVFLNVFTTLLSLRFLKRDKIQKKDKKSLLLHLKIVWISTAVIISQYIIYQDGLFYNNRYSFPTTIAVILLFSSLIYCFKILFYSSASKLLSKNISLIKTIFLAIIILITSHWATKGISTLHNDSRFRIKLTQNYTKTIKQLSENIKNNYPDIVVVLEVDYVEDYEQTWSMYEFMRFFGVKNEIAIHVTASETIPLEYFSIELYKQLRNTLVIISERGDLDFVPLLSVNNKECLSIDVHNPFYEKSPTDTSKVFCINHISRESFY